LGEVSRSLVHLALPALRVNTEHFDEVSLWQREAAQVELRLLWDGANRRLSTAHATGRVIKEPEEWSQIVAITWPEITSVALSEPVHMGKDWRFTYLRKCGEPVTRVVPFPI
jgi:hypothetical protein